MATHHLKLKLDANSNCEESGCDPGQPTVVLEKFYFPGLLEDMSRDLPEIRPRSSWLYQSSPPLCVVNLTEKHDWCCILCQTWEAFMPQTVEGLSGSCVVIPCSFELPSSWESDLEDTCKAVWMRGSWRRTQVFDSNLTGTNAYLNILQGNLTGNLRAKDCTTILNNLPSNHYDDYYFRIECNNALKFNFRAGVNINMKDSLPKPFISPLRVEVEEGASVTLNCSAVAPCPTLPPHLTWAPKLGDTVDKMEAHDMTSSITFTASHLHHRQKISCIALYNRQGGNSDISFEKSVTIKVLYPPNNTTVSLSGAVVEDSMVVLTCNSNANPAVDSFTWYRMEADQVTSIAFKKTLIIKVSEDNSQFYCEAGNTYGTQNSSVIQIDVQFPPKNTTVSADPPGPLLEGGSVTLTCSSHANPAATNYTWYREEDTVESGPTFAIDGAELSHSGGYYCEAKNEHGEGQSTTFYLDVHYPPKNTSLSADPSGPVLEGNPVTLTCYSVGVPVVEDYTWYRASGRVKEMVGSGRAFTFNVTKLSTNQYYCEARNDHGVQNSESVSIEVTFPPEILLSSRCVRVLSQIRCSCESQGNPTPSLEWVLDGEPVNHSADIPIREVVVGSMSLRSLITVPHVEGEEKPPLVCLSINSEGFDRMEFNMSTTETQPVIGLHSIALLIGSATGAGVTMLLCALLQLCFCKKRKGSLSPGRRLVDTSDILVSNEIIDSQVEVVYTNKGMVEGGGGDEGDALNYANIDFVKLQAMSDGKVGEEGIRGPGCKTAEYAEIRLHATEGSVEEEYEMTVTDLDQVQVREEDMVGP
ncbi:myelin-associated glycoprotein-like [Diretmus argenteus]